MRGLRRAVERVFLFAKPADPWLIGGDEVASDPRLAGDVGL
jgi:hypothetical protein